jgi:hypothetical protein
MKRIGLGALLVLLAALAFAPTSSAAQLPLAAPHLTVFSIKASPACTTTPITVAPSGGSGKSGNVLTLTMAKIPSTCGGLAYQLTVYNTAGNPLASSPTGAVVTIDATGTMTVTLSQKVSVNTQNGSTANDATKVTLTIGGIAISTNWTP